MVCSITLLSAHQHNKPIEWKAKITFRFLRHSSMRLSWQHTSSWMDQSWLWTIMIFGPKMMAAPKLRLNCKLNDARPQLPCIRRQNVLYPLKCLVIGWWVSDSDCSDFGSLTFRNAEYWLSSCLDMLWACKWTAVKIFASACFSAILAQAN